MILFVVSLLLSGVLVAADYDHKVALKNMSFEWRLNEQTIDIRLIAKTKGWVAIGFNTAGNMKKANLILAYVKRGKVKISDQFGVRLEEHIRDVMTGGEDNISNKKGNETFNKTVVSFSIPLDSGDPGDFSIDPDKETFVLLAYGKGRDNFQSKHEFRTALKVNLTTGAYKQ